MNTHSVPASDGRAARRRLFTWHWFNLEDYEETASGLQVMTVTYGKYLWFSLRNIRDTWHRRKGGVIRIYEH
ncbi:MAG: hypothetical protein IJS28_06210 [Synergistaceae bacterium]|nr:hypothetical protein [Synergistaceae bacterium]